MVEGRVAMASAVAADLIDRLGRTRVLTGEEARRLCGLEPAAAGPLAVARPSNVEQVEHVVKVGRLRHVQVLARAQFPVSQPDEVRELLVLDVGGLQRPPAIDIGRRTVTVGVGVEAGHVDRVARQARLCLRTLPAFDDGERMGALLARGESGELGLGQGSLLDDIVGAQVVTGGGRLLNLGAADVLGLPSWLGEGVAHPLGQLLASEGRLAVLCEVTLRLTSAPLTAWSAATILPNRQAQLQVATLVRSLQTAHLCDTAVLAADDEDARLALRLCSWRGEADLSAVASEAQSLAERHGLVLSDPQPEPRRVRMGLQPGHWPQRMPVQPAIDWRVSWPDLPSALDLTTALYAEAGQQPNRIIAFGADGVRLRCRLGSLRAELHPLVTRANLLLDAGLLPVGVGSLLRAPVRDHMPTSTKVLLAALQRAWDPEGVLAARAGLI